MERHPPLVEFYTRPNCTLCDEGRLALQAVLEERVTRGLPTPAVRERDISADPALEETYGTRIPVLVTDGQELPLATSARAIRTFLDRALGAVIA